MFIFAKMAPVLFINFCEVIVHSNLNQLTNLVQIRYLGYSCNYLQPSLFIFDLPLILSYLNVKGSSHKKPEMEWQTWNFTSVINWFCCYIIKTAEETAKEVLLSVIWNNRLYKNDSKRYGLTFRIHFCTKNYS